jgi:alpha-L-glutamate ligase-like protein
MMRLAFLKDLARAGVLGINRRNAEYLLVANPRSNYPLVDDKLQTKHLAAKAGIATPELYAVISSEYEAHRLESTIGARGEFVIKPSRGSGGNGIVVIDGKDGGNYRMVNGRIATLRSLRHHVSNILSGMYSLGGQTDTALVEYRVHFDPVFGAITYQGVPDIRVIVYRGVPAMGMIRLPTRRSGGRANLHQGAIGAGIDMATGTTLSGVCDNDIVTTHPDTGNPITGLEVPYWKTLLTLAVRIQALTGLGYVGADFVLDRDRGPLLLELNARPGLNIQLANRAGLLPRLREIDGRQPELTSPDERVAFAQARFAVSR